MTGPRSGAGKRHLAEVSALKVINSYNNRSPWGVKALNLL